MNKFLLLLSSISLCIVMVGTLFLDNNPTFWIASSSLAYQFIRGTLAAVLIVQLVTNPPRNRVFRSLAGVIALGVAGWVIQASLHGDMLFLDSLSLMGAAIAIGITTLELQPATDLATSEVSIDR